MTKSFFLIPIVLLCFHVYGHQPISQPPTNIPVEKVYIHFDRNIYSRGDSIFYKCYVVDAANNKVSDLSKVVYVNFFDGDSLINTSKLYTPNGTADGKFIMPMKFGNGSLRIVAYTNLMRNYPPGFFFSKHLMIESYNLNASATKAESDIALQFFPESGSLLRYIPNIVAFKATDSDGYGIKIAGRLVNDKGEEITTFSTNQFGMGKILINSQNGLSQKVVVELSSKTYEFEIPEFEECGYTINARRSGERIILSARTNQQLDLTGFFLHCTTRGQTVSKIQSKNGSNYIQGILLEKDLPAGILNVTLYDLKGNALAERLLFVNNENGIEIVDISTSKKQFGNREEVEMSFKKSYNDTVNSELSMTILNNLLYETYEERSILTSLLLESELKGTIESPNYYFEDFDVTKQKELDLVMMTHGWSKYLWSDSLSQALNFYPESGLTIAGKMVSATNKKKPVEGLVVVNDFKNGLYGELETDEQGKFMFTDLIVYDSSEITLQSYKIGKRGKKIVNPEAAIMVDIADHKAISMEKETLVPSSLIGVQTEYVSLSEKIEEIRRSYETDVLILDEVKVVDERIEEPYRMSKLFYDEPSYRLTTDSIAGLDAFSNIFQLLRRIPGVQVTGAFPNQSVKIRGGANSITNNSPIVILDGVVGSGSGDLSVLNSLRASDVSYVDVVKGPDAAIFGANGANGVLAIYTRGGYDDPNKKLNFISMPYFGFSKEKQYFTPTYDIKKDSHVKPDFRKTLFWASDIDPSQNLSFYSSDEDGVYEIILQGINGEGKIIIGKGSFEVK